VQRGWRRFEHVTRTRRRKKKKKKTDKQQHSVLINSGLNGTISSAIGQLTGLTALTLTLNQLGSTLTDELGKLTSLTDL
jgi:hypothetical protein